MIEYFYIFNWYIQDMRLKVKLQSIVSRNERNLGYFDESKLGVFK
jgi:hypothetical protein